MTTLFEIIGANRNWKCFNKPVFIEGCDEGTIAQAFVAAGCPVLEAFDETYHFIETEGLGAKNLATVYKALNILTEDPEVTLETIHKSDRVIFKISGAKDRDNCYYIREAHNGISTHFFDVRMVVRLKPINADTECTM